MRVSVRVLDCVCACLCVSFVGIGVCVGEGRCVCAVNRQETPEVAVGKAIYTPTQWGDGVFYFKEQRDRGEGTMCNKHTAVDRQRTPPEAASSTYSIERHKMTVNKPFLSSLHRLIYQSTLFCKFCSSSPPPKYFLSPNILSLLLLWSSPLTKSHKDYASIYHFNLRDVSRI